jgi:hypothetical protein
MRRLAYLMLLVAVAIPLCGCASMPARGRVSALDLDLRDKDQIIAYETEATCIYATPPQGNQPPVGAMEPAASPWPFIFDFLKVMKGRIRVLSIEWQK